MNLYIVTISSQDSEISEICFGKQGIINLIYDRFNLPEDHDYTPHSIYNGMEIEQVNNEAITLYFKAFSSNDYEEINNYIEFKQLEKDVKTENQAIRDVFSMR